MEQNFNFQNLPIRVTTDNEEQIWFAGIDVCKILEYKDPNNAIKRLDTDDKKLTRITDGSGQTRKAWIINLFALYDLILTSTKPEAHSFKRHVTHVILPSIQKAGKYSTEQEQNDAITRKNLLAEKDRTAVKIEETKSLLYDLKRTYQRQDAELSEFIRSDKSQMIIPFPQKALK